MNEQDWQELEAEMVKAARNPEPMTDEQRAAQATVYKTFGSEKVASLAAILLERTENHFDSDAATAVDRAEALILMTSCRSTLARNMIKKLKSVIDGP